MSLIVQKFGGTSVADTERLRNVARIITETYKAGNQVVAVLSAQGDTTDDLIQKAEEINPKASAREMDMLLSTGEQISVSLCAMAIEALGYPVISLTGWQSGISTNTVSGDARIRKVDTERIEAELNQKKIVIVTGFQGIDRNQNITTLGRGGSDTSAVALAAVLGADLCQIYTDVDGVYTADPRKVAGNGFYYLMGDIARLHSAVISYARDFMIDRGFTYVVPPFMIRSNVVTGVMSFAEMEGMMYKIEGEDLYLIGTSEHSMIGKFIDTILDEKKLPYTYTSYSPCFRKEKGAHGIEERGVYRIHQFEKQEMIVVCKPEESAEWFVKLYTNTVDLFRSLDIPVRTLECCSGDLADLKNKSVDVEAWSPRQKKYFEVGSCSNLTDAQARRLGIRVKGENGKYFAHTLNNTVVAPPRMLIAFLENNLNKDGSVNIPEKLQPYMGGTKILMPKR